MALRLARSKNGQKRLKILARKHMLYRMSPVSTVFRSDTSQPLRVRIDIKDDLRGTPRCIDSPMYRRAITLFNIVESVTPCYGSIQLVEPHRTILGRHGFDNLSKCPELCQIRILCVIEVETIKYIFLFLACISLQS